MGESLTIDDPQKIPELLDVIHDRWFDVEGIVHAPESSILSIPFKQELLEQRQAHRRFWFLKQLRVPIVKCFLSIHHVKTYTIRDTEQVQFYDFNELRFDPEQKVISITTGVPIEIEIAVEKFEVSVEQTDEVVDVKIVQSILWLTTEGEEQLL